MKQIIIYTDGACSGNPGPGGWAAVLLYGDHIKELSGGERVTTNQKMELRAAVEALKALKEPCEVILHSDSAYLVNCFKQKWYENWQRNGWRNSNKQPVQNKELWQELIELYHFHSITWAKVKGHSGEKWNERCDELARAAVPR